MFGYVQRKGIINNLQRMRNTPRGISALIAEACFPGGDCGPILVGITWDKNTARMHTDTYLYKRTGTLLGTLQAIFGDYAVDVIYGAASFDDASQLFLDTMTELASPVEDVVTNLEAFEDDEPFIELSNLVERGMFAVIMGVQGDRMSQAGVASTASSCAGIAMLATIPFDLEWSDSVTANLTSLIIRAEEWVSNVLDSGERGPESARSAGYAATVLISYINVTAESLERMGFDGIIEALPDWVPSVVRIQLLDPQA